MGGMDEETEKRLAKLIMEEAAMLRKRADKEGVHVYLAKPTVRVRPNPQFLRATMRSVEHSNRIVEVNEMWRRRAVELEMDKKSRRRRHEERSPRRNPTSSSSSSKSLRKHEDGHRRTVDRDDRESDDDADDPEARAEDGTEQTCSLDLRDEEVEQFLNTRPKRGRGSVGSRMDETGPYMCAAETPEVLRTKEEWEDRLIGPRLPDKAWTKEKPRDDDQKSGPSKRDKKQKEKKEKEKKKKKKRKRKSRNSSSGSDTD